MKDYQIGSLIFPAHCVDHHLESIRASTLRLWGLFSNMSWNHRKMGQRRGSVAAQFRSFASHGFAATKIEWSQSMRGVGYVCVWDSYQILSVYKKNKYVSGVRFICYCHDQRRLGKCCCSIEHFAKVLDRWIAMKYNFIEFNLYKQIYLKGSVAATAHIDHWCWVVQRSVILATQPEGKLSGHHGWTDGHGRLCLRCAFAEKCHYPLAFLVWCNLQYHLMWVLYRSLAESFVRAWWQRSQLFTHTLWKASLWSV